MTPTQHRIMCLLIERAYPMTAREIGAALGITQEAARGQLVQLRRQGQAGPTRHGRGAAWATYREAERARAELAAAQQRLREAAAERKRAKDRVSAHQVSDPFSVVTPRQVWTTAWRQGEGRRQTWHPWNDDLLPCPECQGEQHA